MDIINSPDTSEPEDLIGKYSPFIEEIRKRLLITLVVFAVAAVGGFIFYERIIRFVIEILSLKGVNIVFTSPFQFISLAVSSGITAGTVVVIPLLIYQILSFLKPALRPKEFKVIVRSLPFSIILFFAGFSFGIFVMKWQIQLFLEKSIELGIGNVLDVSRFISTVLLVSTLMGIAFQIPIVMIILISIGVLKADYLRKNRLWVYMFSILFPILLPLDSIFADLLLALPLVILFEFTLIMNRVFKKREVVR